MSLRQAIKRSMSAAGAAEGDDAKATARCMEAVESILSKLREGEGAVSAADEGEDEEEGASRRLRLEGAFIQYFRKEDFKSAFPAGTESSHLIRAISDLDHDYHQLQTIKSQLLRAATAKLADRDEQLQSVRRALRSAEQTLKAEKSQGSVLSDRRRPRDAPDACAREPSPPHPRSARCDRASAATTRPTGRAGA